MKTRNALVTASMLLTAAAASADLTPLTSTGIISPIDNAEVTILWTSADAHYTGRLFLVDNNIGSGSTLLWDNHSASENQSYTAPRLYSQGERIDFSYVIPLEGHDSFSTFIESDLQQFKIDASNPLDIIVRLEDTRYPNGDHDHNDAVFHVTFAPATVPAPGPLALVSSGLLLMSRRRRA